MLNSLGFMVDSATRQRITNGPFKDTLISDSFTAENAWVALENWKTLQSTYPEAYSYVDNLLVDRYGYVHFTYGSKVEDTPTFNIYTYIQEKTGLNVPEIYPFQYLEEQGTAKPGSELTVRSLAEQLSVLEEAQRLEEARKREAEERARRAREAELEKARARELEAQRAREREEARLREELRLREESRLREEAALRTQPTNTGYRDEVPTGQFGSINSLDDIGYSLSIGNGGYDNDESTSVYDEDEDVQTSVHYVLRLVRTGEMFRVDPYRETTIGRGASCTVSIQDNRRLSRNHAKLSIDNEGNLVVEDLKSSNGTFVDGVRISSRTCLNIGSNLELFKERIEVEDKVYA